MPLLDRCVKAGHHTLSGKDPPVEGCEALRTHGGIGQVRETRAGSRQPSKGGCRGAVLYHRFANARRSAAVLPGNGASNSKRKVVRRSSERQGGLSSGRVGFGLGGWGFRARVRVRVSTSFSGTYGKPNRKNKGSVHAQCILT